ncbi:MAG TPA: TadE/TadG family type IV pilus assembly protein [Terriglobales bacterium]|nr:TadE/TadG family type IV pilus assembly protein [Terriglobales bacterium]
MLRPGRFARILLVRERKWCALLGRTEGSAILEFSIAVPLLVVFVVGIYDFSGAFNQKQKIEQAAQEGAIVAAAQPMTDIGASATGTPSNPQSLQPVVAAVFNSLAASNVLPNANQGTCTLSQMPAPAQSVLTWTYTISGCSGNYPDDNLVIIVNRGWDVAGSGTPPSPSIIGSWVSAAYPYHWRFNSVIQLLLPGASYQAMTNVTESASVHNQM